MVVEGDNILFIPAIRGIVLYISGAVAGANSFLFDNNRITTKNRTPVINDKVIVFPNKMNSRLAYIGGTCADEFRKYDIGLTPTNPTPYSTNSTIAVYDNTAYVLGTSGGYIGFGVFNGTGFDYEISPYSLTYATFDITSDGVVWIAGVSGGTLYAIYYDGAWHQETVDSSGGYLMYPNLKLDNNNIPYILFSQPYGWNYCIRLANRLGGSWSDELIESYQNAWANPPTALNFDSNNYPHYINSSAYGEGSPAHEYGYKDGGGWHLEDTITMSDFCIDGDDYPHGTYASGGKTYHYYKDGDGWHSEEIGDYEATLTRINTFNGKLHIFTTDGDYTTWYYQDLSNEWQYCVIDTRHATDWQAFVNFEISNDIHIHVTYYLADVGYVYARR